MTFPEDPNAPAPMDRIAYLLERNRARQGCVNTKCPSCGTPSGPFADPRITTPHGYLGSYHCTVCGRVTSLKALLEKADEDLLTSWLH